MLPTDEFSSELDQNHFFELLGSGSPATVPEESTADEDAHFETADAGLVTLYKVSDASGSLSVDAISTRPLKQEMMETQVSQNWT